MANLWKRPTGSFQTNKNVQPFISMPSLPMLLRPSVQFFVPPHALSHHTVNVVTLWKILCCRKKGITSIISITLSSALLNSCSSYRPTQPLECQFQFPFLLHLSLRGSLPGQSVFLWLPWNSRA